MQISFSEVKEAASVSMEELEKARKDALKRVSKKRWILFGVVILSIIFLYFYFLIGIVGIVFSIVMTFKYVSYRKKAFEQYRLEFKQNVVAPFAHKITELYSLPNETKDYEYYCDYSPNERIDDKWIQRSKLFNHDIHAIYGEDLFTGKLGLTDFRFSELRVVQEQTSTDSDGHTSTLYVDVFKGVLFIADFHKSFDGITILESPLFSRKTVLGKMLSPLAKLVAINKIDRKLAKIQLENEAFNEQFRVHTSDEIQARYLLSSNMMERILEFKNYHKKHKIDISFVDSCMCISIATNKNYFENNIKKEVRNEEFEEVYNDLSYFFGLIEEFNLNTRIWSKE